MISIEPVILISIGWSFLATSSLPLMLLQTIQPLRKIIVLKQCTTTPLKIPSLAILFYTSLSYLLFSFRFCFIRVSLNKVNSQTNIWHFKGENCLSSNLDKSYLFGLLEKNTYNTSRTKNISLNNSLDVYPYSTVVLLQWIKQGI